MSTRAIDSKTEIEFGPFEDPITHDVMEKPVILPCGHAFGEESITIWIRGNDHQSCPTCENPVLLKDLKPDYTLRKAVDELPDFVKKQVALAIDTQSKKERKHNEIIVDWRRIYDCQMKIEDDYKKNIEFFPSSHLRSSKVKEYRHLLLHMNINNGCLFREISELDNVPENIHTPSNSEITISYIISLLRPEELAQKDSFDRTALHLAAKHNMVNTIRKIVEKMPIEGLGITDIAGETALQFALGYTPSKNLRYLLPILEKMQVIHLKNLNEDGKNYLHQIGYFSLNKTDFAPFLDKATSDQLGAVDTHGYTPLHYAIENGKDCEETNQVIDALCKKMRPEDLNKIYGNRENFLHFCLKNNKENFIEVLAKNMSVKAKKEKDRDGKTPLKFLDEYCKYNRFYEKARQSLLVHKPFDQISKTSQFSLGEQVYLKLNRPVGIATILESKYNPENQELTYIIIFPEQNNLKLTARNADLERA